jgi:hypothetical protein
MRRRQEKLAYSRGNSTFFEITSNKIDSGDQ